MEEFGNGRKNNLEFNSGDKRCIGVENITL
jgi:hypothetical protein